MNATPSLPSPFIQEMIKGIEPRCPVYAEKARQKIATLAMPHWALGQVLDLAVELCSMTRSLSPQVSRKTIFICAGDHGVVEEGTSLYPKDVTAQMVRTFVAGGAAVNVFSRRAGVQTVVVDVGVDSDLSDLVETGRITGSKIRRGTQNLAKEPAMTREEAERSIEVGLRLVESYQEKADLFLTGEMGIGNTTPSAAIAAFILDVPVERVVGRGTGLDDEGLFRKTRVIEGALALHRPCREDAVDLLCKVGGFEIGALAGLILGCAAKKRPVVVDGFISTAAALIASRLCPTSMDYVIAAHTSAEKGHLLMWQFLKKKPLLDLQMRLGEGTGGVLSLNLIEGATLILQEMATFETASISRGNDA